MKRFARSDGRPGPFCSRGMRDLPPAIVHVIRHFEPLFSERVWEWAKILLVGAVLAPGKRTVTSALRVMGLSQKKQFQNLHRVLKGEQNETSNGC